MASPSEAATELDNPLETFKEFLNNRGLRVTNQRTAIFDAAFSIDDHFTAEELLDRARQLDDSVSRATVYRTLPILTESSLIREVDVGRDYKYYMANRQMRIFQAQVICVDCDKIFEVPAPFMEWYGRTVCAKLEMEPETQRLQVSARCMRLKRDGSCENKTSHRGIQPEPSFQ